MGKKENLNTINYTPQEEKIYASLRESYDRMTDLRILTLQDENKVLRNLLVEKEIEIYHLKKKI